MAPHVGAAGDFRRPHPAWARVTRAGRAIGTLSAPENLLPIPLVPCAQRRILPLALVLAGAAALAACSSSSDGPLQTLMSAGKPVVDIAGGVVRPGETEDGTAFVVNTSDTPVTLVSASLVPMIMDVRGDVRPWRRARNGRSWMGDQQVARHLAPDTP